MKKLDKLIISSFIAPFILTFFVVVFILLNIQMLKYFDDLMGKGLEGTLIAKLFFYFGVVTTPTALPLAVLLAALITFGNLGEHFELTAIKSAGISLTRTLLPLFFLILILTGFAFFVNNNLVPKAALEAYSLLYDVKQKKPALDLREGTFYNGIPDISIKVNKKFPHDDAALKDIIVYDHRKHDGNKEVIIADSGRMTTILNERYLKFELFNGYNYVEGTSQEKEMTGQKGSSAESLTRSKFNKSQVVFDLSSFQMVRTDKKWFQGNRIMRNLGELDQDMDSLYREVLQQQLNYYNYKPTYFSYFNKSEPLIYPLELQEFKYYKDSLERSKYVKEVPYSEENANPKVLPVEKTENKPLKRESSSSKKPRKLERPSRIKSSIAKGKTVRERDKNKLAAIKKDNLADSIAVNSRYAKLDSVFNAAPSKEIAQNTANFARQVVSQIINSNTSIENFKKERIVFEIQWHKILASSLACVAMFMIGAPLGSIIKKGGLGVPFLVSIIFFIIYYLLSMQGEKLAKQGTIGVFAGVWSADLILFLIGLVFLRQARIDARLFDADSYMVAFDKLKKWVTARKLQTKVTT
ncbi:LptF/LptG family permease [Chryseosolibacter indicus]|uniref:LptF/LptG family permease n=1 Tax=Chryseosolibacter indicus TaxID=2782351 RepID=A0ABS5VK61_9BACT|nr:LptF/LptG family permease [Chryseosolibacter indicus]MBT1701830.1 LptF/LptG family permease [Chryseosolibacter indicus]